MVDFGMLHFQWKLSYMSESRQRLGCVDSMVRALFLCAVQMVPRRLVTHVVDLHLQSSPKSLMGFRAPNLIFCDAHFEFSLKNKTPPVEMNLITSLKLLPLLDEFDKVAELE